MKVTYIKHSCFLVDSGEALILFDYFGGRLPELRKEAPLYVMSSHGHGDHFTEDVFKLTEIHPEVHFLLSADIPTGGMPGAKGKDIVRISAHQKLQAGKLSIETLRSNDLGVAFLVETAGKKLYFAGDLNNWNWDGDEEDMARIRIYHEELTRIRGYHFDAAFIPLDPRLKDQFFMGISDFLNYASAEVIFPMHNFGDYSAVRRLDSFPEAAGVQGRIKRVTKEMQEWEIG